MHQKEHIEHLMTLGLPCLRRIIQSSGDERKTWFSRREGSFFIQHLESSFLTQAFECLQAVPNPACDGGIELPERSPPFDFGNADKSELGVPDAWQWAYPWGPPTSLWDRYEKGLRDWGYVFWNLDRVQDSGLLEQE